MRYQKDYTEHSKGLIWKTFVYVWQGLSNFWQLAVNKKLVTVAWKAWNSLVSPLTNYMSRHRYDFSYQSDSYLTDNYDPIPVELTFDASTEIYDTTTGEPTGKYYVPPEYRNILILQDFINEPEVVLSQTDDDFSFSTGLPNKERGIIDLSEANHPTKMWTTAYKIKSLEEIYERFGVLVDFPKYRHEENETIRNIDKLFYVQQFGPAVRNLEVAICVVNDWPVTSTGGTVIAVSPTLLTIQGEEGIYNIDNDTSLPFRRRNINDEWVDVSVGDVLESYEPLTEAVVVEDIVTNPNWNDSFPISDEEKYHTFLVRFNAGLPQNAAGYLIDQAESLQRLLRDRKIFSKPYMAIVLNVDTNITIEASSYDDVFILDHDADSSEYDILLMLDIEKHITNYGDAPALLNSVILTDRGITPLTLMLDSVYNHYVQYIGTLSNGYVSTDYQGVTALGFNSESTSYD